MQDPEVSKPVITRQQSEASKFERNRKFPTDRVSTFHSTHPCIILHKSKEETITVHDVKYHSKQTDTVENTLSSSIELLHHDARRRLFAVYHGFQGQEQEILCWFM